MRFMYDLNIIIFYIGVIYLENVKIIVKAYYILVVILFQLY